MNIYKNETAAQSIIASGLFIEGTEVRNFLLSVNFSQFYNRTCNYYDFSLGYSGAPDKQCISGYRVPYLRRKPDSLCSIQNSEITPPDDSLCECSINDFDCEFGFRRDSTTGRCVRLDRFGIDQNVEYGRVGRGRKVWGNTPAEGVAIEGSSVDPLNTSFALEMLRRFYARIQVILIF